MDIGLHLGSSSVLGICSIDGQSGWQRSKGRRQRGSDGRATMVGTMAGEGIALKRVWRMEIAIPRESCITAGRKVFDWGGEDKKVFV